MTAVPSGKAFIDLVQAHELRGLLRLLGVNCIIEVGANVVQFAQGIRAIGWKGRLVSFEPVPHLCQQLLDASVDDANWQVHDVALGREDTEAVIHVTPGPGFLSSFLAPSDFGRQYQARLTQTVPISVKVRRLEAMLPELLDPVTYERKTRRALEVDAVLVRRAQVEPG